MTFSEIPFPKSEKSLGCKDFQSSATMAWEAVVLPIYESCMGLCRYYSRPKWKIQPLFVETGPGPERRNFRFFPKYNERKGFHFCGLCIIIKNDSFGAGEFDAYGKSTDSRGDFSIFPKK